MSLRLPRKKATTVTTERLASSRFGTKTTKITKPTKESWSRFSVIFMFFVVFVPARETVVRLLCVEHASLH